MLICYRSFMPIRGLLLDLLDEPKYLDIRLVAEAAKDHVDFVDAELQ